MGDYYEILEVTRDADDDTIKKANPNDKLASEAKFKLVSEAYQILSDPQKKVAYDRYGKEGVGNGAFAGGRAQSSRSSRDPFGGFGFGQEDLFNHAFSGFFFRDPFEMFRDFFGGQDPFADFDDMFGHHHHNSFFNHQPVNLFGFGGFGGGRDPFGFAMPMLSLGSLMGGGGMGGTSSFSSFGGGFGGGGMNQTMTTHQFINGKSISTKREMQNGVETVSVFEDGVLKSKTVNGKDVLASLPSAGASNGESSSRRSSTRSAASDSDRQQQRHSQQNHTEGHHRGHHAAAEHAHQHAHGDHNRRVTDDHARRHAATTARHHHRNHQHHAEPMMVSPEDSPRGNVPPAAHAERMPTPTQRGSHNQQHHDAHSSAASRLKRMVSGSDDDVQIIGTRRHSPKVVRPNNPAAPHAPPSAAFSPHNGTHRSPRVREVDSPLTSTARINLSQQKHDSGGTNATSRLPQRSATMAATPNRPQYQGSLPAQPASVLLQQQQQQDATSPQARMPNSASYSKWFKDFKIR